MIKIIRGYYGYKNGNSIIPKSSKDAPFECDKAEEARLVKLGVAEYVKSNEGEGGLDKEALIAKYKELGLAGNPASWKAETIAKKIAEAEEAKANEGEGEAEVDAEGEGGVAEDEAPDLGNDDGVVE